MKFSLRSSLVALTVLAIVLGWAADHAYMRRDVELLRLTKKLQAAIIAADIATNEDDYAEASRTGTAAMRELSLLKERAAATMPTYVRAFRLRDRFDVDYSIGDSAVYALAAIGPDAMPLIIGLLYDEDKLVRDRAALCVELIAAPESTSPEIEPLPPAQANRLIRLLKHSRSVK